MARVFSARTHLAIGKAMEASIREDVGARIQLIREGNGLTRKQWLEKYGVSLPKQSMWESGKHFPDLFFLIAICDDYGLSLDWLLLGRGDERLPSLKEACSPVSDESRRVLPARDQTAADT